MVELRRSTRQRAKPQKHSEYEEVEVEDGIREGESDSQERNSFDENDESDASEEEWIPPSKKRNNTEKENRNFARVNKRARFEESSQESSDEDEERFNGSLDLLEEEERDGKRSRKSVKNPTQKLKQKIVLKTRPAMETTTRLSQEQIPQTITDEVISPVAEEESDDEATRQEAQRLWQEIRSRKAAEKENGNGKNGKSVQNKAPGGLDQWLGIDPPAWPSTCEDAMINDRDSLFVGFVYTLTTPSQAFITQCLSHLTKVVQPQSIPKDRFPPAMQHLPNNRRGATHDMYAWRALILKRGRDGLGGPEDFGLEEGQEDDGERFGSKEIAKAIRMYGATDVLVIVSRWYGGTMLGPVRFRHIEDCAKAALARHMVNEALKDLKEELKVLDEKIADLRSQNSTSVSSTPASQVKKSAYDDLEDPEKAQRLIIARKKQIEMLQRPKKSNATISDTSATQLSSQVPQDSNEVPALDEMDAEEEEAALDALREMEKEAEMAQTTNPDKIVNDDSIKVKEEIEEIPIKKEFVGENMPNEKVKLESPVLKEVISVPTVKVEVEDETDLTGWDEL